MKKKLVISLALFLVFCLSVLGYAGDCSEKGGGKMGSKILEEITLAGSRQGQSVGFVDVDGDGTADKIVGAPYATSELNLGAVLAYKGDGLGGFSSCPLVLNGDDNYGFSFVNVRDVDGDGKDDFAVGAIHGDGPDVSLSGSVTVFSGGRNWNYDEGLGKIIVKLSGEGPMDKFGFSIAAGDLNDDGIGDLIVGAPFNTNDPKFYQGGAVYFYFGPDFADKVALYASSANKGLGWSEATGDINGDNILDLCISASGKVLCYYGSQDFQPSIDAPDVVITSSSAGFGKAFTVIGDLDEDGFGEIVIGAPNAVIDGKRDAGSAYIIRGGEGKRTVNLNAPSSDLIVRIDGADVFNRFGSSITSIGDEKIDFVVGAPMVDVGLNKLSGKVYLFKGMEISGAATLVNAVTFEGVTRDQGYGASLASEKGWLLIGAPRTGSDTGAVDIVDLTASQIVSE